MTIDKTDFQLDDDSFINQFENQTLDVVHFSHLGHMRLAWLYLSRHTVDEATQKVCNGISAYAESLGAKDKFNITLTYSFVLLMASRINNVSKQDFSAYLQSNEDLVNNAGTVLAKHFSNELLFSEQAKKTVMQPDLECFEWL